MKMATKEKSKNKLIGDRIKELLSRNQRWLADQIHMREPLLSEKINDRKDFTQDDLDRINKILGTSFKL
jgi:plasmid maintenance system antidote protein VapI